MRKSLPLLLGLLLLLSGCGQPAADSASLEFFAMDTIMRLETPGLADTAAVVAAPNLPSTVRSFSLE